MHFENGIESSAFEHGSYPSVYLFSLLGFLLLLIACINYINLTTAKASIRAKEVSIRKIAGAGRMSLFIQFTVESIIVSLLSLFATLILIQICLPVFDSVTEKPFTLSLGAFYWWRILGIALFISLLLNSIYPALLLSSFKPLDALNGKAILNTSNRSFRKGLVVIQFTISVILVVSTIIVYQQMQFIQSNNPGYNRSRLISFALPFYQDRSKTESIRLAMKQELITQSSIEGVALSNQPIANIGSYCSGCGNWEGHDTSYNPKIAQLAADADFQKVAQLEMKEGRWFEDAYPLDQHNVILNETAVKDFNLKFPVIGKPFIFHGDTGQVIGVVKDFNYQSLHEKTGPLVVFNNPAWRNHFMVRATPQNALQAVACIKRIWQKYIPAIPIEYSFMDDTFNSLYKKDQQSSSLVLVFATIAILISMLGLFSLAAFEATLRTKEIGIRKVLGASLGGIAALLSKEFMKLVIISIFIATPIAFITISKWLQNFAYRIPIRWWYFAIAGLMTLMIALITVSFQAIRAAIVNPVNSLRSE